MLDFPKQYKHIKPTFSKEETVITPLFYTPEYHSTPSVEQAFTLFCLDTLYHIHHKRHPFFWAKTNTTLFSKYFWMHGFIDKKDIEKDLALTFATQELFSHYIRSWIIYQDTRVVYRSSKKESPVTTDIVKKIPWKKNRYTLKYFVSTKNHSLDVLTTTPETIFWDVAIAIHPQHKKAKQLKNQEAIIPIINKTIPIIIDERADFTRYGGIYRVTPWHDKIGLAIAKDHGLPTDVYAIDAHWFFSEYAGIFAGKPVETFFSNIIQSLSDIGNLIKTESFEKDIVLLEENNEELIARSWNWYFAKLPQQSIDLFFDTFKDSFDSAFSCEYFSSSYWLITTNTPWILLPVRSNDKDTILMDSIGLQEYYTQSKKKDSFIFWLFILFCITNHYLNPTFSFEEFVDMISKKQEWANTFTKLFSYWKQIFPDTIKEIENLITTIDTIDIYDKQEKQITALLSFLDNCSCLEKTHHWMYIFAPIQNRVQSDQYLHEDFFFTSLLIKNRKEFPWGKDLDFYVTPESWKSFLRTSIFSYYHTKEQVWNSVQYLSWFFCEKIHKPYDFFDHQTLKNYHPDCIRLAVLMANNPAYWYSPDIFAKWDTVIANFWNACRYVKMSFSEQQTKISFSSLQENLNKGSHEFNAFDSRILTKLNALLEEFSTIKNTQQLWNYGKKVFDYIQQDFSGKYLELIKSAPSSQSNSLCIYIIWTLLRILNSYIPLLTKELWTLFEFWESFEQENTMLLPFGEKTYLISLFMDIIDRLLSMKSELNLKKHDNVGIFIRSNPDFLQFAKSNELLLKKILHTEDILYLVHHEPIPHEYKQEDIIDISLGIKSCSRAPVSQRILLQKQIQEKEELLQHVRTTIQHLTASWADISLIQEKKEQISYLKQEIENLTFEISKCKMKE